MRLWNGVKKWFLGFETGGRIMLASAGFLAFLLIVLLVANFGLAGLVGSLFIIGVLGLLIGFAIYVNY